MAALKNFSGRGMLDNVIGHGYLTLVISQDLP
jgi:hypothetical protein